MSKKVLALLLVLSMAVMLAACGGTTSSTADASTPASTAASTAEPAADGETPYIAVVSKGFQHQFWQVVKKGADQAAADYGVEITFDGPPSESDIAIQVDMLKAAMDKNPAAVCLAALDTESVTEQLVACQERGIPVIGFDSGVPNAPEGSIFATASTDNYAAAELAAENMFANEIFKSYVDAATAADPMYIGVVSQDATSESVTSRTSGFVDKMAELLGADNVQVTGHDKYAKDATDPSFIINVSVPATTDAADLKTAAETMLASGNYQAIYGSNEAAANGILAASNDGNDFAEGNKYAGIIAVGFDAGKTQRTAVENGWFIGSITQDPYMIGYKAVELAVAAINGETSEPVIDTGAQFYTAENLSDPMISDLVYE